MAPQIGYCTNVHAGSDLQQTRANLSRYAGAVKARFRPGDSMGVGLWLSANTARQLRDDAHQLTEFRDWLTDQALVPFTLNGFPYGDFHQPSVKHKVYQPAWFDRERLDYTLDLVWILDQLLPSGVDGSISTLPLAWGTPPLSSSQLGECARQLAAVAEQLLQLEQDGGRRIVLSIEPEPGCEIQYSDDIVRFFEQHLWPAGDEAVLRRYIGVCHDVCHAAVMFEDQAAVIRRFADAGITVGKVQISSAVERDFASLAPAARTEAVEQLSRFAEDRYLHQTVIRTQGGDEHFYEDLPAALDSMESAAALTGTWRVHFHVPVYLPSFGALATSQEAIVECLHALRAEMPTVSHFEVETYAWGVLPDALQQPDLAVGIADELTWFEQQLARVYP